NEETEVSWKLQKYLLFLFLMLLISGLSFLIGVSFGASTTTEQFTDLVIPVLSVIGTWISSIAAIVAVFVALWLAEQQRIRESENLDISFCCAFTQFKSGSSYCIKVVSTGSKPAIVNSISLLPDNGKAVYFITNLESFSSKLPISLSYGQSASFFLKDSFAGEIEEFIAEHCSQNSKLKLTVSSTVSSYSIDLKDKI
ncbi:hypothetical protein ACPF3V_003494, partial [Vibrio cholerae]